MMIKTPDWADRCHFISDPRRAESKARALGRRYPHVEYKVERIPDDGRFTILYRVKAAAHE